MKSARSHLFDVVLVAAIALLSFLPAFDGAASSLRILAAIYALFAVLANTIVGERARVALDITFALFAASMAWFETMPANNHALYAAVYAAIAGIVSVWATRRMPTVPASIPVPE